MPKQTTVHAHVGDRATRNSDTRDVAFRLLDVAARYPERPALVDASPRGLFGGRGPVAYTFGELAASVNRIAHRLVACGIERGMRTALLVPPSLEFFALCHALLWVGATPVVVNPGIGTSAVRRCLNDAQPQAYLGNWAGHAARLLFGWGRRSERRLLVQGASLIDLAHLWGRRQRGPLHLVSEDEPFAIARMTPDEPAAILFTTGSTGLPKGALYTRGNLAAQVDLVQKTFDGQPGDVDLPTFPLFALLDPLMGITAVVPDMRFPRPARVNVARLVETIQRYGVTHLFASPLLAERLTEHCETRGVRLSGVRRAITAGAPLSSRVLERFTKLLDITAGDRVAGEEAAVLLTYGATEALPITTIEGQEILLDTCWQTAAGAGICVGRPVAGVAVSILAISDEALPQWDEARLLPPGAIGEIVVEGPIVSPAYIGRPQANALAKMRRSLAPDQPPSLQAGVGGTKLHPILHRTGDLGYLDHQGRLWFCGRKSHRVETRHATFYSEPCEGIFNAHPWVRRTALVGVRVAGEMELALCVETAHECVPAQEEALRNELLALGARHAQTQKIRRIFFHPRFPVDIRHNSKILREQLATWAQRQVVA